MVKVDLLVVVVVVVVVFVVLFFGGFDVLSGEIKRRQIRLISWVSS